MIRYKITITKIEEQPTLKNVWIEDKELAMRGENPSKSNYRTIESMTEVEEDIYTQTREEGVFDLMDVIKANVAVISMFQGDALKFSVLLKEITGFAFLFVHSGSVAAQHQS